MLFSDTYLTIASPSEGIFKDRGSKFLAFAFPVSNEIQVKEFLSELRKEHFSARHHCYAFRIGADKQLFRANDDGEPSGTGGKPILGQLQSKDLTNTLVVVVRYFGGTLLGVSGLIAAYRGAAAEALANAKIIEKQIKEVYQLDFPYAAMNDVMKILKDENLAQWEQDFQLECKLKFSVRKKDADLIIEKLGKFENVKSAYLMTI
ncbi:MAG: YigZ family protein [Bacteroidetes bacterium]|nr:YigZ family protein [Bacteroidota bacterium]